MATTKIIAAFYPSYAKITGHMVVKDGEGNLLWIEPKEFILDKDDFNESDFIEGIKRALDL